MSIHPPEAPPQPPQPQQPQDPPQPQIIYVKAAGNSLAVTSLCFGIAGVLFGLAMFFLFPIAWALGGTALVLGILGRRKARTDPYAGRRTMATWGIILGIAALGLGTVGAVVVQEAVDDVDEAVQEFDRDMTQLGEEYDAEMEEASRAYDEAVDESAREFEDLEAELDACAAAVEAGNYGSSACE